MKRFTHVSVLFLVAISNAVVQGQEIRFFDDLVQVLGTNSSDEIIAEYVDRRSRVCFTVKRRSSGAVLLARTVRATACPRFELKGRGGNDLIRNETDIPSSLRGGPDRDTIHGGSARDEIDGGEGDDTLYGGPDNDIISGGDGADRLYGEDGDDFLVGGDCWVHRSRLSYLSVKDSVDVHSDAYADEMHGGAGFDVFAFESNDSRVGVHWTYRRNGEMTVAQKHASIFWNGHAWPPNGGWFNPVRVWQLRG